VLKKEPTFFRRNSENFVKIIGFSQQDLAYSVILAANRFRMARKKKTKIKELQPKIKVRLDSKTVITIRDMAKLDFWKEKFPNAVVIS